MNRRLFLFWLPPVVWMFVIFYFSTRTRIQISDQGIINFLFFKTLHILEYAILYTLVYRARKYTKPKATTRLWYWSSFIITVAYAVTDEIHQLYVPSREGRLRDVIIDAAGAGIAWIAILTLLPKAPKKLRAWVGKWQLL